jgi:hypothetical protein
MDSDLARVKRRRDKGISGFRFTKRLLQRVGDLGSVFPGEDRHHRAIQHLAVGPVDGLKGAVIGLYDDGVVVKYQEAASEGLHNGLLVVHDPD